MHKNNMRYSFAVVKHEKRFNNKKNDLKQKSLKKANKHKERYI